MCSIALASKNVTPSKAVNINVIYEFWNPAYDKNLHMVNLCCVIRYILCFFGEILMVIQPYRSLPAETFLIVTWKWAQAVSNHRSVGCLLTCVFRRRSKKTSKLCVSGLCEGNSPVTDDSPHKGPVTRKVFPFDDVTMALQCRSQWDTSLHIHRLPTLARNMLLIILC